MLSQPVERGLSALNREFRALFVMANSDDANPIREDPIEKVIWEPLQIRAPQVLKVGMKPHRISSRDLDVRHEFIPELVSQPTRQFIVAAQRSVDVFLNGGVVGHLHWRRSRSTRSTNSSCEISSARPLSRSASRCITSSSEISLSTGGKVASNEAAKCARSVSVKARAFFSTSATVIRIS